MKGFTKEERSRFNYWFAHWCAFNMTALIYHAWKFKYLFHDIEKPWMRLFCEYPKVQKWHRSHNNHHVEYWVEHGFDSSVIDWEAMVWDWECSRQTKLAQQRNARETLENEIQKLKDKYGDLITYAIVSEFRFQLENVMDKYKV